jgi:hypothetical protein
VKWSFLRPRPTRDSFVRCRAGPHRAYELESIEHDDEEERRGKGESEGGSWIMHVLRRADTSSVVPMNCTAWTITVARPWRVVARRQNRGCGSATATSTTTHHPAPPAIWRGASWGGIGAPSARPSGRSQPTRSNPSRGREAVPSPNRHQVPPIEALLVVFCLGVKYLAVPGMNGPRR